MSFLEIEGLSAGYGNATVLRNLSLSVDKGEALGVLGRNGAGKSTLLLSIFGQTRIFGGQIRVGGVRTDRLPAYRAAHLGVSFSPQGRLILPNLTVEENLSMSLATGRRGEWTLDRVYELFPILRERARQPGTALSGGQLQMLAIGRALMANPEVLVLDEPTEGLAPVIIQQIGRTIRLLKSQGFTIVLVEQNFRFAASVADRHYVVEQGRVVDEIATADLDANTDKLHAYLGV